MQRAAKTSEAASGDRSDALIDLAWSRVRSGDFHGALEAARNIGEPKRRTAMFSRIAVAQGSAGDMPGAARSFSEALSSARRIKDASDDRLEALIDLVESQMRARNFERALEAARDIGEASWRATVFRGIAVAQASAGDMPGAARSFFEALSTARSIGDAYGARATALSGIATAQASAGDFRGALATVRNIENGRWRAIALGSIVSAQVEALDRR